MQLLIFIRHQIEKLRDWQAERESVRHLKQLDDHFLRDIGIERQDIEKVVHGLMTTRDAEKTLQQWLNRDTENRLHIVPAE